MEGEAASTALTTTAQLTPRTDLRALTALWQTALDLRVRSGAIAETTRRTYTIGVGKFVAWCEQQPTLNDDAVSEWIAALRAQGCKPAAINTWLAGVRSFFVWATTKHHLPYNLTADIHGAKRKGTTRQHGREALTDREVMRVLAFPDRNTIEGKRDYAIIALMAFTAARTIELHRADVANLRTDSGRLVLEVQGKGHTESDALLVIANPLAEAGVRDWLATRDSNADPLFISLSDRSRGSRLSLRAIRDLVKRYYKAAGVRGVGKTTHSLRHAAITNAVRHGAPVQKVRTMARHDSIETTMIYYHEVDRVANPAEDFIAYEDA